MDLLLHYTSFFLYVEAVPGSRLIMAESKPLTLDKIRASQECKKTVHVIVYSWIFVSYIAVIQNLVNIICSRQQISLC